ncbi:hypothetical protein LSH36_41g12014 [Paralvinella palmiformis]|uniref:Uncharacterized protein n=1 Tax=Paralvinella palmiformis TaxID=53620 RepID=A0AAD9K8W8_9ANNE|nr:hypothetical protein LSH36_41g12014 [Paralvinella palmiformis]
MIIDYSLMIIETGSGKSDSDKEEGEHFTSSLGMEAALHARDQVGVQDFVLLEEYKSVTAFVGNLKKRFVENLIYTYIGPVLISVNPYKALNIYNEKMIQTYRNVNLYELPPHIFAIADAAYRAMRSEYHDQCVLISGESGAGKTEASKKILHYIAAHSSHSSEVGRVKDRLLQSNPVLEAFGNAKTIRNDNSSRFGKYMDIQFDFKGAPVGGVILNYLLEKSRVVHQSPRERNFHIFYQLVRGANDDILQALQLDRDVEMYNYLNQGGSTVLDGIDDAADWRTVTDALTVCSFTEEEKQVSSPLSRDQSMYARDAFAKGVYERLFMWLVSKINTSLASRTSKKKMVLGLLDIYGFEIFELNSFEQFCINYCNEKLQQLFITLTLKSEQEEYLKEGIEDEECLRPGNATDGSFLEKLSVKLGGHPHFLSYTTANVQDKRHIARDEFRLLHYAGEVTYNVKGFLDKNNDTLFRDIKEAMSQSKNLILQACFPESELASKKRPDTAGTQFRTSLLQLMDILLSKQPSYIRCIKPNDDKKPHIFEEQIVRHQVKYLGLMENLRVRRAGFAYRREYELFLERYKSLCPQTWPRFNGPAKEGVHQLCQHLNYGEDDYKMGKTKIFIRLPKVLFATEDALQLRKHELAASIQARFRGYVQRKKFLAMKSAAIKIASVWRMYAAKQLLKKRRRAANIIRKFIKGFTLRGKPVCEENRIFIGYTRYNYLDRIKQNLPKSVLDKSWPKPPQILKEVADQLHELNTRNLLRKYMFNLTPEHKAELEEKVVAERLFKDKKESYPQSIAQPFSTSRLDSPQDTMFNSVFCTSTKSPSEEVKYASLVNKYDSRGYTRRGRVLIITSEAVYILNQKDFKLKLRIPFAELVGKGKEGLIEFSKGEKPGIVKSKNRHLTVVVA